jgi:hypothetical protein
MQVSIAGGPLILRHPQATERFFALLRMTALKLKPKKQEIKRKTKYNHTMQAVLIIALGEEGL